MCRFNHTVSESNYSIRHCVIRFFEERNEKKKQQLQPKQEEQPIESIFIGYMSMVTNCVQTNRFMECSNECGVSSNV